MAARKKASVSAAIVALQDAMRDKQRGDKPIPTAEMEELVKLAIDIINTDYWDDVRGIGMDILGRVKSGDITDREQLDEAVNQDVDGTQRVIYTYQARLGMLVTNNADEWEEMGLENPTVEQQMYAAMRADVMQWLDARDEVQELS